MNDINKISNSLWCIVESIYQKIFHEELNEGITNFGKNISYVFIGTFLSTIFSFIFNVMAGRSLGLHDYGEFTLVNSIATILSIPMLLGTNTAMVKYNSENSNFGRQKDIISSTYILVGIFSSISILIYILFEPQISKIFLIQKDLYYYSILFALLFIIYTLTTNTLQSLHEMKNLSIYKLMFGLLELALFVIFINCKVISVKSALVSIYLAYTIPSIIMFLFLFKYLKICFKKDWAKIILNYGFFNLFTSISFILYMNIDKLLINTYMAVRDVGLYNAYSRSSISIVSVFTGVIATVLFPTMSKYNDKKRIITKINKIIPYLIIFVFLLLVISQLVILKLYGKDYPIDYSLIILFSIAGVLFTWYDIYAWIFNSAGVKGVKITMLGTGTIAVCDIILNIYLIPIYGLDGAIGATVLSYVIGMCIVLHKCKLMLL